MEAQELKELAARLLEPSEDFKPGDLVEWKPGLKHKKPDGPFVVLELLEGGLRDMEDGAGSMYFMEPLNIMVGMECLSNNGELALMCTDKRRFQLLK